MDKSYNIIAAELLDLVKTGWGITQACRKLEINNSDLVVCLNRNAELATAVKERFNITADGLSIKTNKDEDERAKLRARAEQLGLKPHSQLGVAKLKKLIETAEAEIAGKNKQPDAPQVADETPKDTDVPAADDNSENPNDDAAPENTDAPDGTVPVDNTNPDGGTINQ